MYCFNFNVIFVISIEAGRMLSALQTLVHFILHVQLLPIFYEGVQFSRGTMIRKYFQVGKNRFPQISWLNMEKHTPSLLKALLGWEERQEVIEEQFTRCVFLQTSWSVGKDKWPQATDLNWEIPMWGWFCHHGLRSEKKQPRPQAGDSVGPESM